MCLYFDEQTKCSHPECIYVIDVKQNYQIDFKNHTQMLAEIEITDDMVQQVKEKKRPVVIPPQKKQPKQQKIDYLTKDKKTQTLPFIQTKQPVPVIINPSVEIGQFIDTQLKLLLNQNVADFIIQLSSRYTQNLKTQNTKNQQKLLNLQKRLQGLQH